MEEAAGEIERCQEGEVSGKTLGHVACDAFTARLVAPRTTGGIFGGLESPWSHYSGLGQAAWEAAANAVAEQTSAKCNAAIERYLSDVAEDSLAYGHAVNLADRLRDALTCAAPGEGR